MSAKINNIIETTGTWPGHVNLNEAFPGQPGF